MKEISEELIEILLRPGPPPDFVFRPPMYWLQLPHNMRFARAMKANR